MAHDTCLSGFQFTEIGRTMPPLPSVRDYRTGDAPLLWNIFFAAVRQTAAADYTPEQTAAWAPAEHDPAVWSGRMDAMAPLVAESAGVVVGYAGLRADGYIDHFFVAPPARRGFGSALMRAILERAAARGIAELFSNVSLTARPFFERFGFAVETPQQVTVRGVVFDNFRMRRRL